MAIDLRPYQIQLKNDIYEAWRAGHKMVMAQMPTGSGKTKTFSQIAIEMAIQSAERVPTAIMVHRKELVQQISLTLAEEGITHNVIAPRNVILGIVGAHRRVLRRQFYDYNSLITVVSVDTLNSRIKKHEKWAESIRLWITDEAAHLLKNNKWGKAVGYFPNAIGLGVTATPRRLDKRGLGRHTDGVFDVMVEGPSSRWLIENGYLCRYKIAIPPSDYKNFLKRAQAGADYSKEAMIEADKRSHIIGDVVENYKRFALGKQAIVFAAAISTGREMEKKFNDAKIPAKLLTGETPDKERLDGMLDFRNKKTKVLLNVDLFDEGLDCLDMETEVLTPDGWKNYSEMKYQKFCYGWNPETHQIEIVNVDGYFIRSTRVNEKMWTIKSQHSDIRVTEGHRIYFRKKNHFLPENMGKDVIVESAKELHEKARPFAIPLSGKSNFSGLNISDDELKILGWYLTDGWTQDNGHTVYISQTKKWGIRKIHNILKRLKWDYRTRIRKPTKHNYPNSKPSTEFSFYSGSREKVNGFDHIREYFNKEVHPDLHLMTRRQFKIFWNSLMDGDGSGHRKGKSGELCCARKKQVDSYMHMAAIRGFACMYGTYLTKKGVTIYNLRVRDSQWLKMVPKDVRGAKFEMVSSKEKVWCISNRLGTLVTRRKGKVAILGNCPGIECVIMARPTMSLSKYLQMIGRGLRPSPGKEHLILIDHVGNVTEHGLPDSRRIWTLDRIIKKRDKTNFIRICSNIECNSPYDRVLTACPWCGTEAVIGSGGGGGRTPPVQVDGDLELIDPETLHELAAKAVLEDPALVAKRVSLAAGPMAGKKALKAQQERIDTQHDLVNTIAKWAGVQKHNGYTDRSIHKMFFITFDWTISEALSQPRAEMLEIIDDLRSSLSDQDQRR